MKLLQFPTCWPMNELFVHWSRGWGVLSFSERLVVINLLCAGVLVMEKCEYAFTLYMFVRDRSCYVNNSLQWRHNGRDSISNHQPHNCLLNRSFRRRSKKTSKLRVTGLCAENSMVTGEFPTQMASNAENVSIWWRHHVWVGNVLEFIFWNSDSLMPYKVAI